MNLHPDEPAVAAAPDAATAPQPPGRRRRWLRWLVISGLGVLLLYFLPEIVARTPLRNLAVRLIVRDPRFHVYVGGASLGWTRPPVVYDVDVRNLYDEPLFTIQRATIDSSPWQLFKQRPKELNVFLHKPRVKVQVLEDRTNFHLPPRPPEDGPRALSDRMGTDLRFHLRDTDIALLNAAGDVQATTSFDTVDAELMRDGERRWLILEPITVWDHLPATPELTAVGLQYAAPILADAAWISGSTSVNLQVCRIDLNQPADSVVHGVLTLHEVTTGPKGPIVRAMASALADIGNRPPIESVKLARECEVTFRLEDRRVYHQGLSFGLPDVSPDLVFRTHGSVGLDKSLDLDLGIPLPWHLLRRREDAPQGEYQVYHVPIRGTLDNPLPELTGEGRLLRAVLAGLTESLTDQPARIDDILPPAEGTTGDIDWFNPQTLKSLDPLVTELADRLRERRARRAAEQGAAPQDETETAEERRPRRFLPRIRARRP